VKKIIFIIFVFIFIFLLLFIIINKSVGFWKCENGKWEKQGNPNYPKPIVDCANPVKLPKNKDECIKIGGVWAKQGPEPFETCNRKTIDRGNLCRDNSECEGMCQVDLTKDQLSQGMRGKLNLNKKLGQCSVWVVELGCKGIMQNGKAQVICID
jgi:hypothetical protein